MVTTNIPLRLKFHTILGIANAWLWLMTSTYDFVVTSLLLRRNSCFNNKLCAWRHNMSRPSPPPWAPKPLRAAEQTQRSSTFPRWPLQPPYALRPRWVKRPGDLDLWPFDLESGVRVTCDVGYLCANFGLSRPLCSRVTPDARDRQTSDKSIA